MKVHTTYSIRVLSETLKPFSDMVFLYRKACKFFINVINTEWAELSVHKSSHKACTFVEQITTISYAHQNPKYNFTEEFQNFPVYLRRAAIAEAYGLVTAYQSSVENWNKEDKETRGKCPIFPNVLNTFPFLYKDNCYVRLGLYEAKIKVWMNNGWNWLKVGLRKTDVDYIQNHCKTFKECSPALCKRGRNWELSYSFEKKIKLETVPVLERRIVAVDLGINNAATCCVMNSEGKIIDRKFLSLEKDYIKLNHALELIKRAQRSGAKHKPKLWAKANGINEQISVKTAKFIEEYAVLYNVDVVVMEYLDLKKKKKKGSRKQRLALWKVKYVQKILGEKCHRNGIRFSTVTAWNTSRLAFDGSGFVLRGNKSTKTHGSYSVCEFQSGKVYNCDLNASYNIGARYYIREILGSMSEKTRLALEAKVPPVLKRSTCTLSTLYDLRAAMSDMKQGCVERGMSGEARDSDVPKGQPNRSATD